MASKILSANDHVEAAAKELKDAVKIKNIPVSGWIEIIFGLITAFRNCRGDGDESDEARVIRLAKEGRGTVRAHAKRQARRNGARGPKQVRVAAKKSLARIAKMSEEEVASVLNNSGV